MKHAFQCVAMALAFVALVTGAAFAADTTVDVPYGQAAASALNMVGDLAWLVIAGVLSTFAKPVWGAMRIARLDQLLERQLKAQFEKHAEALRANTISIDLKNEMIANAARGAVAQGQASLIKWAGAESIPEKLLARFSDTFADWLSKQRK